jgi:RHS repeat-associated protein
MSEDYRQYRYDLLNRLTEVLRYQDGNLVIVARYGYDINSLRIYKEDGEGKTTHYVYDATGNRLETHTDETSSYYLFRGLRHVARRIVDNASQEEVRHYYGTDHLGSTVLVTGEAGEVLWSGETNPFGDSVSGEGTGSGESERLKYTGKDFDEDAGLYYFNARWYDPGTGRFITEDPIRYGANWYGYANNNPLMFDDPRGLRYEIDDLGDDLIVEDLTNGEQVSRNTSRTAKEEQLHQIKVNAPQDIRHLFDEISGNIPGFNEAITSSDNADLLEAFYAILRAYGVSIGEYPSAGAFNAREREAAWAAKTSLEGVWRRTRLTGISPFNDLPIGALGELQSGEILALAEMIKDDQASDMYSMALTSLLSGWAMRINVTGFQSRYQVNSTISQKQLRHVRGTPQYRGGGVMDSIDDAQAVLSAFRNGDAVILGYNRQGFPVVRYEGVTGTNINLGAGITGQPTNVFIIKGTTSPSVVPTNPMWGQ